MTAAVPFGEGARPSDVTSAWAEGVAMPVAFGAAGLSLGALALGQGPAERSVPAQLPLSGREAFLVPAGTPAALWHHLATGSRLLSTFKKPLSAYLGGNAPDLHCFRWTRNTLDAAFRKVGLCVTKVNPYMECDWLVMAAEPLDTVGQLALPFDQPQEVAEYFRMWQKVFP